MIGLNQITESPSVTEEILTSRRRRTPSQYAESIRELTKMSSRSQQRIKTHDFVDQQSYLTSQSGSEKSTALICILPGRKKKLKLHVIIKKQPKNKVRKSVTNIPAERSTPKEQPKNQNLLDVLFKLCEEQKWQEQQKMKEALLPSSGQLNQSEYTYNKEHKPRKAKQEEEKYIRMHEKYQQLNQKLEEMENQTILL